VRLRSRTPAVRFIANIPRYYDDVSVTHEDSEYMRRHYEMAPDANSDAARGEMYYVRTAPENREKIEMSFNLSNYQPQLVGKTGRNIFQTIFLNKSACEEIFSYFARFPPIFARELCQIALSQLVSGVVAIRHRPLGVWHPNNERNLTILSDF
jgi:hypothetical protein